MVGPMSEEALCTATVRCPDGSPIPCPSWSGFFSVPQSVALTAGALFGILYLDVGASGWTTGSDGDDALGGVSFI